MLTIDWQETHPETEDPLKLGLKAAIAKDFPVARVALWRVVADDPRQEVAWQWLAKVAENRGEQEFCLARAVALDPENERRRLSLLMAQQYGAIGEKPEPRGACIFCDLPWASEPISCVRCRAIQRLDVPTIFLDPLDVNIVLVRRFVDRLLAQDRLSREERRGLVLGLLNLGELLEAVGILRQIAENDPRDEEVRALLLAISGRLDAIEIDSGFETEVVDRPTMEELGLVS